MMSLLSLCLKNNFDQNLALLISSLATESVETIGNKNPINKGQILKSIKYLLK